MATINFATREITAKVVYFGAKGAGCNTNVERLFVGLGAKSKGQLHKFGARDDEERSLFFEYKPTGDSPLDGFATRWRVYSLPGGVGLAAHREEVMRGADAVVFVADARPDRNTGNVDALLALEGLLGGLGLELAAMPLVIQVNHTDAPEARLVPDVTFDLNPYGFPVLAAVAKESKGVAETHAEITGAVVARVRDALAGNESAITLTAVHDASQELDADLIRRHVESIQERSAVTPQVEEVQTDEAQAAARDHSQLPEGPAIEVPFQPREFVGSHPISVIAASVDGDRVWVDLVMERMGGGESRRLTVVLANRPTDTPAVVRSPASPAVQQPIQSDRVFDYLPEPDVVRDVPDESGTDLPGIWYGILGITGGVLIGLLLGYILGLVS